MSNRSLAAEVNRLSSILSSIEGENNQLRGEIGLAVGAIAAAETELVNTRDKINSTLDSANSSLMSSHERVIKAYETQQEIDAVYGRLKNMELANKKIRACNNTRYYEFKVYRTVRKIVQGMMDNLDFSMIGDDILEKAIEKEHLAEPDFWLTSLIVAVCAWRDDQPERARRALERALELDSKLTASFMLVFNLRLGREEVAFKWFEMLSHMPLLGSDKHMMLLFFSLLSHTIEDDVSDAAKGRVRAYVRGLFDDAVEASSSSRQDASKRIRAAFFGLARDRSFPYPTILQHVETSGALRTALALARNDATIIDFVTETMTVDQDIRNEFLKEYVDKIVEEPCPREVDIYEEIARNELIIKYQGDVDAAQNAYEASRRHDVSDFDIIAEMLDWVYTSEGRLEANPQMRRNMMIMTAELQQLAADDYVRDYRALFRPQTTVTIEDYSGPCDLSCPLGSAQAVRDFYHAKAQGEKDLIKDTRAYIAFGVGGAIVVAALLTAPGVAVAGLLAIAVGAYFMLGNSSRRKRIDLSAEQGIRSAEGVLEELGKEWSVLESDFRERDLLAASLQAKMASL